MHEQPGRPIAIMQSHPLMRSPTDAFWPSHPLMRFDQVTHWRVSTKSPTVAFLTSHPLTCFYQVTHWRISTKSPTDAFRPSHPLTRFDQVTHCRVSTKSPIDVFRPITGLIDYTGVIRWWRLLSHAQNAVGCLALSICIIMVTTGFMVYNKHSCPWVLPLMLGGCWP